MPASSLQVCLKRQFFTLIFAVLLSGLFNISGSVCILAAPVLGGIVVLGGTTPSEALSPQAKIGRGRGWGSWEGTVSPSPPARVSGGAL